MGDPLRRRPLCVGRALLAGWAKCTGVAGVCQTACSLARTAGTASRTRWHSSVRDGDAEDITRSMRGRGNSDRAERATAAKMTTPPAASTASGVRFAGTYFLSVATFPTTPPRAAPPRVPAALPVTRAPPTAPIPAPTAVLRCFSVIPEQPAKVPATRRTAAAFANVFMIVSMGGTHMRAAELSWSSDGYPLLPAAGFAWHASSSRRRLHSAVFSPSGQATRVNIGLRRPRPQMLQ